MEFRVLGPLEVRRDGRAVDVRGSKRRTVLALLVLHANEVVRAERLIEEVWGEHRPANASAALQNHISRLRKELGADVLVTKPWGYVLRAQPDEIDVTRFQRLVAESKPLAASERAAMLADALALWRGPPFADLADEPALSVEIARLEDLRLAALEQRIDADLELGRNEELIPELEGLIAEHSLRERLRGQLILALYRSGRQAEALETYRETRRVLVEELGIEPSPELRELERAILRQDPALASTPPPVDVVEREPPSKWRWPRSPLVVVGSFLLLAAGGVAVAMLATRGDETPVSATLAQAPRPEPATTDVVTRVTVEEIHTRVSRERVVRVRESGRVHRQPKPAHASKAHTPPTHTTRPVRRQPTSTRPFLLRDDFGTSAFDFRIWHRAFNGSGWDLAQRNGGLEIALGADAVGDGPYNIVEAHYGTNCKLAGDFDVRSDFRLLTWPEGSGASVALAAWRSTSGSVVLSRFAVSGGEGYEMDFPLSPVIGSGSYPIKRPSDDGAGALRLRRRDDYLTAYYRRGGSWEIIGGIQYLGNVIVALQLWAGKDFSHQPVRVAFDNFVGEAEDVECPSGVAPPPRKPRP